MECPDRRDFDVAEFALLKDLIYIEMIFGHGKAWRVSTTHNPDPERVR